MMLDFTQCDMCETSIYDEFINFIYLKKENAKGMTCEHKICDGCLDGIQFEVIDAEYIGIDCDEDERQYESIEEVVTQYNLSKLDIETLENEGKIYIIDNVEFLEKLKEKYISRQKYIEKKINELENLNKELKKLKNKRGKL